MKKLLLPFLLLLPLLGFGQTATQKVVNTAVIYATNSPVTFSANFTGLGADYLLNNQTLTGNGSIVTRVLGDARYSPIGGATTNSNTFAGGTTNDFYDVIVRNILRVNVATILNTNLLVNGNITVTNNTPIMAMISTNANQAIGGGSLARYEAYVPGFVNGSIFGAAGSTNATIAGSLPGDTTLRGEAGQRILFGNGTAMLAFFDSFSATKSLIFTNGTTLIVPTIVTSGTNNSTVYQVSGVTGFNGVVTNDIGVVTNIMFYGSGILTNLVRIGP